MLSQTLEKMLSHEVIDWKALITALIVWLNVMIALYRGVRVITFQIDFFSKIELIIDSYTPMNSTLMYRKVIVKVQKFLGKTECNFILKFLSSKS
jgi:hypothetical protein